MKYLRLALLVLLLAAPAASITISGRVAPLDESVPRQRVIYVILVDGYATQEHQQTQVGPFGHYTFTDLREDWAYFVFASAPSPAPGTGVEFLPTLRLIYTNNGDVPGMDFSYSVYNLCGTAETSPCDGT